MKYLTTYIRRRGERGSALLLQEYVCRGVPACFACLCLGGGEREGAGRRITEKLLTWNRRFPWHKAVRDPGRFLARAQEELEEVVRHAVGEEKGAAPAAEKPTVKWRLFLCVDQEFLTLGNGFELFLLSAFFGRGRAVKQSGSFQGLLEPGVGVLLAEEGFLEETEPQAVEQVIRSWEVETQTQLAKRLGELNRNGRIAGGEERTAILLLAKEDA
ncbi:MAG: hypothetical protein NC541_02745 [bacterium]|nr:hypothetical protein [bacterium]